MPDLDNQPLRLLCSLVIVLLHGTAYALGGWVAVQWLLGIWVATVCVWCLWNVIEAMSP